MYGETIAAARRARGLSQVQLAAISGIEQANISAIEHGRRNPSAATLHRLLHACGFELIASAGSQAIACTPPAGDEVFDALLTEDRDHESPLVTRDTPVETRVQLLTAVLDVAEAVVRARAR